MNEKKKENKEKKNFFKVIWLGQVKGEMKVFSPQVYQFFFFFFQNREKPWPNKI